MTEYIIRNEEVQQSALGHIRELDLSTVWMVEVKRYRRRRSIPQNALLHKWFQIIADETGNEQDEIKEFYREKFLGKVSVKIAGEEVMIGRSTADLSVAEMTEFMNKVQAHAGSFFKITLPIPEEGYLR